MSFNQNFSSLRSLNRHRRHNHLNQQSSYLDELPDFHDSESTSDSFSPSVSSLINEQSISSDSDEISEDNEDPDVNQNGIITKKLYFEVVISAFLSKIGLSLSATEMVVNLVNNVNLRFSRDPVIFSSVRYLWDKRAKKNVIGVYIICENKHSHGPFSGEPRSYGSYICDNHEVPAEIKNDKYFLHINLRSQLENHLPMIPDSQWISTSQFAQDYIDDISNARSRRKFKEIEHQISTCEKKLSLTLHADEVQAGNSSSVKIFPIFISINELKPEFRRKHFFLCGLFVGKVKPLLESFLGPICEELKNLEQEPVIWINRSNILERATFHLIGLVADAPMRAYLRGARQYNHTYGCDWCLICASSNNRRSRHFSIKNFREIKELKRTHQDFIDFEQMNQNDDIEDDFDLITRFQGIIGGSPLLELKSFNIVDGVIVEHMHCLVLGICRSLILKGWFGETAMNIFERNVDKNSFRRSLSSRITAISVPSEFTRSPRDFDQIKYWKSSEYDSFLVYYFPALIKGLLKQNVINHFMCFVKIFQISHCGPIKREALEELRNLIYEFQHGVEQIYGSNFLTYNLHILSHLPDSVLNHGPNKNISSYALENYMGILKEKVRRSSNIAPSLVRIFINDFKYQEILNSISNWPLQEKEKRDFGFNSYFKDLIPDKVIPLKEHRSETDKAEVAQHVKDLFGDEAAIPEFDLYKTVSINGKRFSTVKYSNKKIRCDSAIKSANGEFLLIKFIFRIRTDIYALCDRVLTSPFKMNFKGFTGTFIFKLPHLYEINRPKKRPKDQVICRLLSETKKCLIVKSTELSHKYAKDLLIEPFLFNF